MFTAEDKLRRLQKKESDLLEMFILLEENNYTSTMKAVQMYKESSGIQRDTIALVELKAKYEKFINT